MLEVKTMLELVSTIDKETQFSKVKPFDLGGLEKARPIKDFAPTLKRTKKYDLGRIKFFLDNPDQIGVISLEEDEDGSVVITDGNHRFQAALLLGLEKVEIERTFR